MFQSPEKNAIPLFKVDDDIRELKIEKLKALKQKRNVQKTVECLAAIRMKAASGENLMPAQIEGRLKLLLNTPGHVRRFARVLNAIQQDRKFVTTQTRHHVCLANAVLKAASHGNQ